MLFIDPFPGRCYSIFSTIKMSSQVARSLEDSLYVYLVGHPLPPYMKEEIELPYNGWPVAPVYVRKMPFALTGVWVANWQTGEVLSKGFSVKRL
ncbi:hypothetical protein UNDKW_1644 [Undibacterium sp. KW1]|uniref:hypothetical protein n=1 Tax=Undibacterium sp. KW1 TaxID=2058624 RepID=UPI001331F2D8|nr:hypothetical protein [Undibacterium sp. KW1]BBB59917.1 hypothetical protein UNDKW_1644 [Undibacterium sp. KW1]